MDIVLATLFIIICVLLILVVLLQKGRGGGLGAAFGGMGSAAFGTRIGDVFTWVTIVLTALFLLLAIGTSMMYRTEPGQVRQPEFKPPAGQIEKAIEVEITCPTQGSKIYFTLDGTDPTEESTPYEGKRVRVVPGRTLKARAYRTGWAESAVATAAYPKAKPKPTEPETRPAPAATGPGAGTAGPGIAPAPGG